MAVLLVSLLGNISAEGCSALHFAEKTAQVLINGETGHIAHSTRESHRDRLRLRADITLEIHLCIGFRIVFSAPEASRYS